MPAVLGAPRFWVLTSGVAEIAVGLALIVPATRAYGGLACAALLVVLYWANLYMWVENVPLDGKTYANVWHVVRLLIQLGLIAASCSLRVSSTHSTLDGRPHQGRRLVSPMRWVIWLGWIEGLSAVLLMCIATPVKYLMDAPHMVEVLGPIHGVLFMLYVFALMLGVGLVGLAVRAGGIHRSLDPRGCVVV